MEYILLQSFSQRNEKFKLHIWLPSMGPPNWKIKPQNIRLQRTAGLLSRFSESWKKEISFLKGGQKTSYTLGARQTNDLKGARIRPLFTLMLLTSSQWSYMVLRAGL